MRLPQHIILDFEKKSIPVTNWYSSLVNKNHLSDLTLSWIKANKKGVHRRPLNPEFLKNSKLWGVKTSEDIKNTTLHKLNFYILHNTKTSQQKLNKATQVATLSSASFLRKEKLYTKLKYSRSPAYDTVSGGAAALLAGFIGFLISEKYGFELVDSGDFYYLFMYCTIFIFSVMPLLPTFQWDSKFNITVSPKAILRFFRTFFILVKRWLLS